jgi:leucyl aminopeptidase
MFQAKLIKDFMNWSLTPLKSPLKEGSLEFKNFFEEATKYILSFSQEELASVDTLLIFTDSSNYKTFTSKLDEKYGSNFLQMMEVAGFEGKEGSNLCSYLTSKHFKRASIFILPKEVDVRAIQELGAKASNIISNRFEKAVIESTLNEEDLAQIYYGLTLRNYRFDKYFQVKKEGKSSKLKSVIFANTSKTLTRKLEEMKEIASHNALVRDLVNSPAGDLNPATFSKMISHGFDGLNVKVKVIEEEEMQKLGMHSLLAVGHASVNRPRTVVMEYYGNPSSKEVDFAIVGKGVCFDSGGYSLKPAGGMEDMKCDMAGSAVAFSTIRLIAKMGLKANVIASVGLVENLVSGTAYKPGDVLRSMSGQTIEVLNTDAEGRLVLADVLYYTQKNYAPKNMVNLATLTGAVTIALADVYAGLMYNNLEIASKIEEAGEETGELAWRLPFRKEYDDMINSTIADVKNIGSARGAGTITAGQFLKRFVNFEKGWEAKWAHLDIAGVAFDGKGGADPKVAKGGTGWGVHLLYKMAKRHFAK